MACVLGFDGGGTKTECVLMNGSGHVIARGKGSASNPTRIGFSAALQGVVEAADSAVRGLHTQVQIVALCAGLAGTGLDENRERMRQLIAQKFPGAMVSICADLDLPLLAMPAGPAVVLVAGTGSAAIGKNSSGAILREGGLGPSRSDEGSAFDIGRKAMAAARDDDSAEASDLSRQILLHLGAPNWPKIDNAAAEHADAVFPRIFPVVAAAADAGNCLAQGLLNSAAKQLADMTFRLADRLGLSSAIVPVAKVGGTIGRSRFFDSALDRELSARLPHAAISTPAFDLPAAAAHIALQTWRAKAASER